MDDDTTPHEPVPWSAFRPAAPQLASAIAARFEANVHHVLGTIRPDGTPRLSGTEVSIADGQVSIGMMPGSRKLTDVQRDPRVELHTAPIEQELAFGDAKLSGRLVEAGGIEGAGYLFHLEIHRAVLVHVADDELVIERWRPGEDVQVVRRA